MYRLHLAHRVGLILADRDAQERSCHCHMQVGQSLKSVQLFNPYEGDYTFRIYSGDTYSPGTMTYEETFHLPGNNQWETLRFSQLVPISNTNNLWIVGRCMGNSYPVPVTTYCGNTNGGWTSTNGVVWSELTDMTIMFRAIFAQPTDVVITAVASDTTQGHVQGGGRYAMGESCTLTAIPTGDNIFDHWNDGNTDNPRTFSANAAATYTAYFSGCGISTLPATQDFSAGLDCWTTYSASTANASNMTVISQSSMWGTFAYFQFCSQSYSTAYDQYLISPLILAPNAIDLSLSYRVQGTTETFNIEYSTTDNSPSSFTHVVRSQTATSSTWDTLVAHIPAEAKYIAIHYTSSRSYYLYIDDIQLVGLPLLSHTVSVVSESDAMGSASGGGLYEEGSTVTIAATPNSCYEFAHWQDGNTQNPRTIVVGTTDATYTASFTPVAYYGVEQAEACDSLQWHGTWYYESSASASFTTTTAQGCDSTVTLVLTIHHGVAVDTTIYANGSYTLDGETYTESTTLQLHLTTVDGCDSLVTLHLIINSDEIYYTVTARSCNDDYGRVEGGGQYLQGVGAELVATPNPGYVFERWDNGVTMNPYTLVVESDTTVVAVFVPVQGIGQVASRIEVRTQGLQLTALNAEGRSIEVVDVMGRRVADVDKAAAVQQLRLPSPGLYFVWFDHSIAYKVMAR